MNTTIQTSKQFVEQYRDFLVKSMDTPAGVSFYNYILENGEQFNNLNLRKSQELKARNGFQIKQCYYNCQKIARFNVLYRYFEGWGCSIIPVPHAFLVDKTGSVVDPTWARAENKFDYFGIEIPKAYISAVWREEETARELIWTHLAKTITGGNNGTEASEVGR